jgi:hypothetical protein
VPPDSTGLNRLQQDARIRLKPKYLKARRFRNLPGTALGTVGRMIVFNGLQIGHLPKRQEVAAAASAWPRFRRSGLLKLEELYSYIIDYDVTGIALAFPSNGSKPLIY